MNQPSNSEQRASFFSEILTLFRENIQNYAMYIALAVIFLLFYITTDDTAHVGTYKPGEPNRLRGGNGSRNDTNPDYPADRPVNGFRQVSLDLRRPNDEQTAN